MEARGGCQGRGRGILGARCMRCFRCRLDAGLKTHFSRLDPGGGGVPRGLGVGRKGERANTAAFECLPFGG